jgi:hypothetical protein
MATAAKEMLDTGDFAGLNAPVQIKEWLRA